MSNPINDNPGLPRCGRGICPGDCDECNELAYDESQDENPVYDQDYEDAMKDVRDGYHASGFGTDEIYNNFDDGSGDDGSGW